MRRLTIIALLPALFAAACYRDAGEDPAAAVNRIASEFLDGYYQQFPEEAFDTGYPDAPLDRFGDHSTTAIAAWNARVDAWLEELDAIDTAAISNTPEALTYAFTRQYLASLAGTRVCRRDLWNVSPTWSGWQAMFAATLAVQPVGSPSERAAALARVRDIARYLDVETANLRRGTELGYLAARSSVDKVIGQVTYLADAAPEDSPLYSPASRSGDAEFRRAYVAVLTDEVYPAMTAYRDFLRDHYRGHEAAGVGANPDGGACYAATVHQWSSLPVTADDVHRKGLSEMARLRTEMHALAREAFGTDDMPQLLEDFRSLPEYTFPDEEAVLDVVRDAVERSAAAVPAWFGTVPDVAVNVYAVPAFEQNSGGGYYAGPSADGSQPPVIRIGTHNPTGISRTGIESLAFHEGYPGHHLQTSVARLNTALHPVLRYLYVSGSAEGWGLYAERLADEMGLYSDPVSRFGMLSNQAFRAARLVVDSGLHVMGWSRDEAIDYLLQNTSMGRDKATTEVDRYIATPGQATSYLLGSLEIVRLRRIAEETLGERFDIRVFHDRVLVNGGITLPMLADSIESWVREVQDRP